MLANLISKRPFAYFLILPVSALLIIYYYQIYQKIPIFYSDEHEKIAKSYYFELLVTGDLQNTLWKFWPAYDQPKLVSYYSGAILYKDYLKYKRDNQNIRHNYNMINYLIDHSFYDIDQEAYNNYLEYSKDFVVWNKLWTDPSYQTNESLIYKHGPVFNKPLTTIYKIRRKNIFVLSVSLILVYILLLRTTRSVTISLTSSLLYGLNHQLVSYALRAQAEGLFLMFFNLCLLQLFLIITSKKATKTYQFLLFGISIGLLNQIKINGIMILLIFNIIIITKYLAQLIKIKILEAAPRIHQVIIVNLVVFFVFVAIDPYLYTNPTKNTLYMYQWRDYVSNTQTLMYPDDILNPKDRLYKIYQNLLISNANRNNTANNYFTQLFPFRTSSSIFKTIWHNMLKILFITSTVYLFGTLVFKNYLLKNKIVNITQITSNLRPIVWLLILSILVQLVTSTYLKLDWDRYYLHLIFFFTFMESLGLYLVINLLSKMIKR